MNHFTAVLSRLRPGAFAPLLIVLLVCGCGSPSAPSGTRITGPPPRPRTAPPPVVPPRPQPVVPTIVQPPPQPAYVPKPSPSFTPPVVTPPALVVAPPPVVAPPVAPRPLWLPLHAWATQAGLSAPVRVGQTGFQVKSPTGPFLLNVGTRKANWNGYTFNLGFAPTVTNGVPYVHSLDVDKNLVPLLQVNRPVSRGRGVIVLDPGHGGVDNGTKSPLGQRFEKDYTLDWARRLKSLLEARGWKVVLTRNTDVAVELGERVMIAEQNQADLFISLHLNAANAGVTGLETYCLTPAGMASTLTRGYADPVNIFLPGNSQDAENMRLAMRVHRSLLQNVGMADRGVQRARFMAVLKTQQRPAILVEGGYLSDHHESKQLDSPEYRQKLAAAVAKALE